MKKCYRPLFFILAFVFGIALSGHGQSRSYFSGKIIIKYNSETKLQTIRSTQNIDPVRRVQDILYDVGATSVRQIGDFSGQTGRRLKSSSGLLQAANEIARIYEVSYTGPTDPKALAAKLGKMPGVAYAEPKYLRRMQFSPDDPTSNPYQNFHRFEEAWDITRGSSDVIIAVVDGGVNYLHTDMDDKLWINTDEVNAAVRSQVDDDGDSIITSSEVLIYLNQTNGDYNGDGTITLADAVSEGSPLLSGGDTDGNDYEDDIFGWDFWAGGGVDGQPATQDNDPMADGTDHGAHVAGIAAAETDNGEGISGAGFNVRYMNLKAGGIPDDPSTNEDESRLIGFGYEGILYAALEGADVINCSWGGGSFSEFENDIINFATEAGALVVAASGNAAINSVDFPSGYANVLSVGSVETSDQVSSFSNDGYDLDVFATGSNIESTGFSNNIVSKSGTSMSTPVVAGLAGLLKSLHPEWSPLRIAAQIRSSAAFLDRTDSRQGHGKIDALRAVTTLLPGVRILSSDFTDPNGEKLSLNEEGTIRIKLINYGRSTSGLSVRLASLAGAGITLSETTKTIGSLASGDSTEVEFGIEISETYDLESVPTFRLNFTDNSLNYDDFDVLQYNDILFDVVDANNVKTSFGGDGTIGFVDAFSGRGGVGFIPRSNDGNGTFSDTDNVLFEGGLIIEAENTIFDAVRSTGSIIEKDFEPLTTFSAQTPGTVSAQDGQTRFGFKREESSIPGTVRLETFSFTEEELSNVVFLKYSITNPSQTTQLNNVYVGLFNDWDMGENIANNNIAYSQQDSILYISDGDDSGNEPIIAVAHLGEISSALAINNFESSADATVDLRDGFSDSEKRAALKAGTDETSVSGADVSAVTATGPFILNPEAVLTVGFVYAYGNDLDELRSQIQAARQQAPFTVSETGIILSPQIPDETDLFQNFPNPFTDRTTIRFDLSEASHVRLTLYDVLGREVEVLIDRQMEAAEHSEPLIPRALSSGIYFLRLQTDQKTETIPITYIK